MNRLFSVLFFVCIGTALTQCKLQEKKSNHLASSQLIVLNQAFKFMESDRTVRIYLPPNYHHTNKNYPVIYMHDAQNLFSKETSFAGEWQVDESLDSLANLYHWQAIVVGIDNGKEKRAQELTAWANQQYNIKPQGKEYVNFIVNEVKPTIDHTYRTKKDAQHTVIAGSSLGGLITHYAMLQHPDVFGKGIIFSPSYWFAPEVYEFTTQQTMPANHKIYMLAGGKEDDGAMVNNARKMQNILLQQLNENQVNLVVDKDGTHTESFWQMYFDDALVWLFEIESKK